MSNEIHGYTMTQIFGDGVWRGEFGTCFATWIESADQPRAKADYAAAEDMARKLRTKAQAAAALQALGVAYPDSTLRGMRTQFVIARVAAWWPRKFVTGGVK